MQFQTVSNHNKIYKHVYVSKIMNGKKQKKSVLEVVKMIKIHC
jgi:hypothetical protein